MRLEKQDGGWGYAEPAPRPQPMQPAQLPPRIQFLKNVLIAVAILGAIIGVPTAAAEAIAHGITVSIIVDAAWSIFLVAAVLITVSLTLLQMGWDS